MAYGCSGLDRNNELIQNTTSIPPEATAVAGGTRAERDPNAAVTQRAAAGTLGLLAIVAGAWLLAAGAAGHPTGYVPARSGGWPVWLAGPLAHLGVGLDSNGFQALTLLICVGYALVLATARTLSPRAIALAIVAANAGLLLGPPLISQDVFGYLAFARMGVLHGLDPYTRVAAEAPADAIFPFIGWSFQHSPYGPLFTLGSYALVPLGLGGGLWALKTLMVAGALAAIWLTARAAGRERGSGKLAAAFVGLNPVLLELAVGGAHNDTLVLASLAGALALNARMPAPHSQSRAVLAVVAGIGVKASAGLMLPFLVLAPARSRDRARLASVALAALALLAAVAIAGFGTHAFGFLGALGEQQQLVATHSIPAETARWLGLSGVPTWWRDLFLAGFAATLAVALWRTARGADWRSMAGWATLALLLSTAWLLPWYAIWLLPLAALADSGRLRVATLAFCLYAVLIHLPLADPLLSPPRHVREALAPTPRGGRVRAVGHDRVVFAGMKIVGHVALDLGG